MSAAKDKTASNGTKQRGQTKNGERETANPIELTPEWQREFMARYRIDQARIPKRFQGKSFQSFKTERKKQRREILQAAESYVQSFNFKSGPFHGLILQGPVGSGKTHIAVAILKGVIEKGYTGLFYNMLDLLSDIRASFNANTPLTEDELLEEVNQPDLLVIDDLGAERTTDWVNDRLYFIVNRRYQSGKPILVTTNLDYGELSDKIGDRIVSRLCEMCSSFAPFPDEDYRKRHMR